MTNTRQQYRSYHFPTIDGDGHDGLVPKDGGNARQSAEQPKFILDGNVSDKSRSCGIGDYVEIDS